jgi:hypothetical protein
VIKKVKGPRVTREEVKVVCEVELLIIRYQMASKSCPMCKTFSSSSNTTLNAHIDHCLSVGSTKGFELDVLKPKIKPRKKKLMAKIYVMVLHYTLEDLDLRNGTNWAASSIRVDPIDTLAGEGNKK